MKCERDSLTSRRVMSCSPKSRLAWRTAKARWLAGCGTSWAVARLSFTLFARRQTSVLNTSTAFSPKTRDDAAFDFPRCSYYCDRWIRHGDWYPDRVLRLWRKGSAAWTGIAIHERLEVRGAIGHLRADLLHYSNESINWQLDKIGRYADPFVRHCLDTGRQVGWLDLTVRPVWKFFRAYFLRLGFLDGWPGYYIAWLGAFSTVTRYAKVCEARLKGKS